MLLMSKIELEKHFKTRPFGEIFYPAGDRDGKGYVVRDEVTSALIRYKIKIINWLSVPFTGIIFYLLLHLPTKIREDYLNWFVMFLSRPARQTSFAGHYSALLRVIFGLPKRRSPPTSGCAWPIDNLADNRSKVLYRAQQRCACRTSFGRIGDDGGQVEELPDAKVGELLEFLDFCGFGKGQSILNIDTKIADGAFDLRVAKQDLFMHLFAKKEKSNVTKSELAALKTLAKAYMSLSADELDKAVLTRALREVKQDVPNSAERPR